MSESAALLAAIRQAPDDDAPRLIYADWLDEHGQPERAEFIRVQIELARHDSPELRKREAELLAEHHDRFAHRLAAPGLRFGFKRGFIASFGHTGVFYLKAMEPKPHPACYQFSINGNRRCWVGASPEQFARFVRSDPELLGNRTQYVLDAFQYPATLRFPDEDFYAVKSTATLWGSEIGLHVCDRHGKLHSVKPCEHIHIDGFDSFSDSP